jgi:hypothetical protein
MVLVPLPPSISLPSAFNVTVQGGITKSPLCLFEPASRQFSCSGPPGRTGSEKSNKKQESRIQASSRPPGSKNPEILDLRRSAPRFLVPGVVFRVLGCSVHCGVRDNATAACETTRPEADLDPKCRHVTSSGPGKPQTRKRAREERKRKRAWAIALYVCRQAFQFQLIHQPKFCSSLLPPNAEMTELAETDGVWL